MPNRKRNQPGIFTHAAQGYSQPMKSRFDSIYGSDYDEGENYEGAPYHFPRRPVAQPYSGSQPEWRERSLYYDERDRRNFGNYGDGGYYGPTYNQANEWNQNAEQNRRRPEEGRSSNDRYQMGRGYDTGREAGDKDRFDYGNQYYRSEEEGQHRGKGPRGYQRADDRIRDDINDRLADDSYLDATEIEVIVLNGEVTLSGEVESRTDKRRAEDLCEGVSGVRNVENRLRVKQTFGEAKGRRQNEADAGDTQRKRSTGAETIRNFN